VLHIPVIITEPTDNSARFTENPMLFRNSQLPRVARQSEKPTNPDHEEDGWKVWRAFNTVTEAIKPVLNLWK
jgi:hypothetical protein